MSHRLLLLTLILLASTACDQARTGTDAISSGMKWTIAQRDLEQHGWVITVAKPTASTAIANGKAYRYTNAKGEVADFIIEKVGDTDKIYRIFDGNGREIQELAYKEPASR